MLHDNGFTAAHAIEVVSIDSDEHSPSYGQPCFYKVPYATDTEDYLRTIRKLIERHHIHVILPTGDFDPKTLEPFRLELLDLGTILAFSPAWVFDVFEDKYAFASENPKSVAPTALNPNELLDHKLPWMAKPRYGVGSRGLRILKTFADVERLLDGDDEDYVFQPLYSGEQFTVDVLCGMDGKALQAVTRKVYRLKGGSDAVCHVIAAPKMEKMAMSLCEEYGVIGAACFEFMFDDQGEPKIIDAQPRLSGSHGVTALAGLNLPQEIIRLVRGETFEPKRIQLVEVVRTLGEEVIR